MTFPPHRRSAPRHSSHGTRQLKFQKPTYLWKKQVKKYTRGGCCQYIPTWALWMGVILFLATTIALLLVSKAQNYRPHYHVAFVGNSMQYYNDFPRFMKSLSDGKITQNSCLHGDANLYTLLVWGNGMFKMWQTGPARISESSNGDEATIYDFGACTVPQLLFGYDAALDQKIEEYGYGNNNNDDDNAQNNNDDYMTYRDGKNPCLNDENYYEYLQSTLEQPPKYDFLVINDNTRAPARQSTREQSLEVLETVWADYILETKAIPIFICTYGYWTPYRDMSGLDSVANFTSLTYNGYAEYANLLSELLPASQQPRLALVGHAFLLVYEENYQLWERLFHVDGIHASPLGTYLQGLCVYYAMYQKMPLSSVAFQSAPSNMWQDARRFQPGKHRRSEFPTRDEAHYLMNVATRVMRYGVVPESLELFDGDSIAADFEPSDDLYRVDDIFRP